MGFANPVRVRVYDSGHGIDRYCAFVEEERGECLVFSANASSPQGVCQWAEADEDDGHGERIAICDLPQSAYEALEERVLSAYGWDGGLEDDGRGLELTPPAAPPGPRLRPSSLTRIA